MDNLMAHCDTNRVDELQVMAVPEPEFTDTWHPVSHARVINSIQTAVENAGIEVVDKQYSLNTSGTRMFGVWQLDTRVNGLGYAMGIRNSIDKSMAIGICAGTKVFVCDNLAFSGDFVEFRKHTGRLFQAELNILAKKALGGVMDKLNTFAAWHQELKSYKVGPDQIKIFTFDLIKAGVVNASKFKDYGEAVREEWKLNGNCVWSLHGAATRLMRGQQLFYIEERTRKLTAVTNSFVKTNYSLHDKKPYSV